MSGKKTSVSENDGYLFSVDILIEAGSNGQALEKLLRILNREEIVDYRVVKGISLGAAIEAVLQQNPGKPVDLTAAVNAAEKNDIAPGDNPETVPRKKTAEDKSERRDFREQIEEYKHNGTLVRLIVVKGKGVKLSVPCRILNIDWANGNITVYHVDEKKVYLFHLFEIDDMTTV